MEIEIEGGPSIGNWEDYDDFVKDAQVEDLNFCKKIRVIPHPRIVDIGVGVIAWPNIEVMKRIGLFNSEVLT